MTGIVEFLTAQVDIDQATAEAADAIDPAPWTASASDHGHTNQRSGAGAGLAIAADGVALWDCEGSNTLCMTAPTAEHVAAHDPARVLREVAAKRRLVEFAADYASMIEDHYGTGEGPALVPEDNPVLRLLAAPYAAEPGYDERWQPDGI